MKSSYHGCEDVDNTVTHFLLSYLNCNRLPTSLVIVQCPFEKKSYFLKYYFTLH